MTNEPYYLSVPVTRQHAAPYPPIAPYAPRASQQSDTPVAPSMRSSVTTGQLVAAVAVTLLDLFLFLPCLAFTAGVGGVLVVPVIVSLTRSSAKGYDTGKTWLRAAIVGLVTLLAAATAAFALLMWLLSTSELNWF